MKKVMVRAWEIAKTAVLKFGGKVKEYFSQALAIAWAEMKNVKTVFSIRADKNGKRSWVAKITGTHPTYKVQRSFINAYTTDFVGNKVFELEDGYYNYDSIKERGYVRVQNGFWSDVTFSEVLAAVK